MKKTLSTGRILLYSSASAGLNILSITVGTWVLYFYAPPLDSGRTQYLPIGLVGVLWTITILWDALIDPFIGHWSDTLRSRWGRRRPFMALAAPLMVVAAVLIWTPPTTGLTVTAVYFVFVTLLYSGAFSLVGIPYDATLPEMAGTPERLVPLSMWKQILGLVGVLIGALVAAPLFDSIGPVYMGLVVGVVALISVGLTLIGLRDSARPVGDPIGIVEGIGETFRNRQFLIMFVSTLIVHIAYAMVTANLPYHVTLVVGRSEADVGIFLGVVVIIMGIFAPIWNWLATRFPHRRLLMVSLIALGVALALNYTVGLIPGVDPMVHGLIVVALIGPTLGGYLVLAYAMMGSIVDYDEMFTHRRREAIYYGTFSLAVGIGPSIAAVVLTQTLERFGYTAANPLGVRLAWVIMGVVTLIGAAVFTGYRLGDTPEETRRLMGLEG